MGRLTGCAGVGFAVWVVYGGANVAAERRTADVVTRVDVLLTTSPVLPSAARTAMMDEAAHIWRQQGVALDWLPATDIRPAASSRLRVLVVASRPTTTTRDKPFAVGELVRPASGHPVALISIDSARRLVRSLRGRAGYELIAIDERRLGVVLGRALAHEIGHYLLGTHTHATNGLMRPQFDALEFTDLRVGTFALDPDAADWLRSRSADTFAYVRKESRREITEARDRR
jgi:hypothetical protein